MRDYDVWMGDATHECRHPSCNHLLRRDRSGQWIDDYGRPKMLGLPGEITAHEHEPGDVLAQG